MQVGKDYIGVGVGACIFNQKGEILLLKRTDKCTNEPNTWSVPGGHVEYGETLEKTVIRECLEEIGITVTIINEIGSINHITDEFHYVSPAFFCLITTNEKPINKEPDKHSEIKWFKFDKLPKNTSEYLKEIVKKCNCEMDLYYK